MGFQQFFLSVNKIGKNLSYLYSTFQSECSLYTVHGEFFPLNTHVKLPRIYQQFNRAILGLY